MNKFEVVPELRFSGFNKAWTKKRLKEIGTFLGGGTPSKTNPDFWTGLIPWVSSSDITDDSIHQIKVTRFITEDAIAKSATKLVPENTILLVSRVGVGKLAVTTKTLCTSQDFANFTPSEDDVYFLAYYLKSKSTEFLKFNQGMAIQGFTKDDISNFVLYIPQDLDEQQKVADCLSSIDDLITKNTQKLEALKLHKKGLIQKLFPVEGNSVPECRISGSEGYWIEKELKDITSSIFDGTHQTPKYTEDGVPFFSVENIVSNKDNKFISIDDHSLATVKNKPELDDIIITRIGKIGFTKVVDWDYDFSIYVTLAVIKNDKRFNSKYLHSYMQSERFQNELQRRSLLNAVPCKINMDELRKSKVMLPLDIGEQNRIADCLSSLDDTIESQSKKIKVLKKYKKGLMQKLFPEMEGDIA
ncbi:restriction endonuclease subunit S [Catenovulum sp. 2E275]|uniref:restriction endonuclease subunit S n=1 Tax=Catenovulum sp. 2E275 TaxID=2980497 RepID=UPI0021D3DC57|nr:restriction endonuclease subunit S [Catenovulum sp. 2E275]MCU4675361.1 restriction endonuclease subunit S [Catenovulum sp. 2E275]